MFETLDPVMGSASRTVYLYLNACDIGVKNEEVDN